MLNFPDRKGMVSTMPNTHPPILGFSPFVWKRSGAAQEGQEVKMVCMKNSLTNRSSKMRLQFLEIILGVSLLAFSPGTAWTQGTGAISGRVEDASGAAAAGAMV